jgi:hypothetical protein
MGSKKPETADFSKNNPSFILRYSLAHQNDPYLDTLFATYSGRTSQVTDVPQGCFAKIWGFYFSSAL